MILTGWIIAGGIILFIILLLALPVVIYFDYGETLYLKVKYLFLTLYRIPAKPKKRKKPKNRKPQKASESDKGDGAEKSAAENITEPKASAESAEKLEAEQGSDEKAEKEKKSKKEKKEKDPKIPTLPEIFELLRALTDSLGKPLKKLLRRIRICDLDIRMICGGEDAAKAALNFGKANLVIGNALGFLGSFFTLKNPHVDINVDFMSEETVTECSCVVKVNALTALAFVFCFTGRLIVRALRSERIKGYLNRLKGGGKKKAKTAKAAGK